MKAPTKKEIATAFGIVRGMLDWLELDSPQKTDRERIQKHKTLKILMGTILYPKVLKGAPKGMKRNFIADRAVISDIKKFGSLPKAVKAHHADGRLERNVTERSHIERIRSLKKHME